MQIFTGAPEGEVAYVQLQKGSLSKWIEKGGVSHLYIGAGEVLPVPRRKLIVLLRKAVSQAKQYKVERLALEWKALRELAPEEIADSELGEIAATAFVMAEYEFTQYKTSASPSSIKELYLIGTNTDAQEGVTRGIIIATEVNATRTLANTPGGDMTPTTLAQAAKKAAEGTGATVEVLDTQQMERLGMGAVLGIGKGSGEEPKFIIVEYKGADASTKPVVLVGKGVTFDTGGLNIKTGDNMYEMHMDMSGGAAVIHAAILAAKLKIPANVVALIPAVENAPGSGAVRPGDILKSYSGKTIEVLNTDAEGRVIMADAISYAKKYDPAIVIDVATLTGAALVALGLHASAVMASTQELENLLRAKGEESGEYVWPFPLWDEYEGMTKGHFGDVPNISTQGNSRYGGVIAGGMFLWQFAKELGCPWAHIDMAPRMTAAPGEELSEGAAGAPVRLLYRIISHYAKH